MANTGPIPLNLTEKDLALIALAKAAVTFVAADRRLRSGERVYEQWRWRRHELALATDHYLAQASPNSEAPPLTEFEQTERADETTAALTEADGLP